ncbi:MAG: Oxidoreductase, partial [uncultured Sphingomonadaceae bacterium]
ALQQARRHRPVRLRTLPRHHDFWRLGGNVEADRRARSSGGRRTGTRRRRRGDQLLRHRRRLRRRRVGGDHRPGAARAGTAARPLRRGLQGVRDDRRRPQPARRLARPPAGRVQGEPAPARHRPPRPLPDPRLRPRDAHGGNAACARRARAARPRPLRRPVELGGVAGRQGAGDRRAAELAPPRLAPGLLHAGRPRPGARDCPHAPVRARRADGLEPARRRFPVGQICGRRGRRRPPRRFRLPAGGRGARPRRARRDASDRGRARRVDSAGRYRLAPPPTRGEQRDRRRQAPGPAPRQHRRDGRGARPRGSRRARRREPPAPGIPGLDARLPGQEPARPAGGATLLGGL